MTILISRDTRKVIVDFSQNSPEKQFRSRALAESMAFRGIQIPEDLRGFYENREIIYLGDDLFPLAFKEIYVPVYFPDQSYYWADRICTNLKLSSGLNTFGNLF